MNIEAIIDPAQEKLSAWAESFLAMLPNIALAILALVSMWLVARLVRSTVASLMGRTTNNRQVIGLTSSMVYFGILVAGVLISLQILQLERTVTSLLAGAGIVGLALGFAFQDLATNLMSGVLLATSEPIDNGDIIKTGDYLGKVESVHLRHAMVRTFDGQLVRIPNKQIFENPLVNYTQPGERRVELMVGVSYDDDLRKARKIAMEAISKIDGLKSEKDVQGWYTSFDGSSIGLSLRYWIDYPQENFMRARSEGVMLVKEAFDEAGISIPFPIRTLEFASQETEILDELVAAQQAS